MKICWDMLEDIYLTRSGTFRKNSVIYVYKEACMECGEPYLAEKRRQSKFCSHSCAVSGKNNPMYGIKLCGILSGYYKGGVSKSGLTIYNTCKDKLETYEDIRKQHNTELLEAKCAYCGKWFTPTYAAVNSRFIAINNLNCGEGRLYCSNNCKQACPTYNKQKYPKGFKHATSREVSTYLRQIVFERDDWECQKCGKTIKEIQLHCHHMDPATQNPMFQNDANSCITLCKDCHKSVHMQHGCRYVDLKCKKKLVITD